jgi:hypothetical protein
MKSLWELVDLVTGSAAAELRAVNARLDKLGSVSEQIKELDENAVGVLSGLRPNLFPFPLLRTGGGGGGDVDEIVSGIASGQIVSVAVVQLHASAALASNRSLTVRQLEAHAAAAREQGLGKGTEIVIVEAVSALLERTFGFWAVAHQLASLLRIGFLANLVVARRLSAAARLRVQRGGRRARVAFFATRRVLVNVPSALQSAAQLVPSDGLVPMDHPFYEIVKRRFTKRFCEFLGADGGRFVMPEALAHATARAAACGQARLDAILLGEKADLKRAAAQTGRLESELANVPAPYVRRALAAFELAQASAHEAASASTRELDFGAVLHRIYPDATRRSFQMSANSRTCLSPIVPPWVTQRCSNHHELAGKPTTVGYQPPPKEQLQIFANCWGCNSGDTAVVQLVGLTDCPMGKVFREECAAAKGVILAAAVAPRFDAALAAPGAAEMRAAFAAAVAGGVDEDQW